MRVLLPCLDFPPETGGIQTMLGELALRLSRSSEVRLRVLTPRATRGSRDDVPGVDVVRTPLGPGRTRAVRGLPGLLAGAAVESRRRPPDVWLCGHAATAPGVGWLARRSRTPYLVVLYDLEIRNPRLRRVMPGVFRDAAAVLAISRYTAGLAVEQGCPEERIRLLPPGVDPTRLRPSRRPPLPDRFPPRWILTAARLDAPYKGADTLLQALPRIRSRVPECGLVIAGEGRLRPELAREAAARGLAECVHFPGRVSDAELGALYRDCALFALLSREEPRRLAAEGFGLVCLEAAAFGRPVVAARSGGLPEAVRNGETGLLVDPDSPDSAAEAVVRLLLDPALSSRLGAEGMRWARTERTWDRTADLLLGFLREAVETASSSRESRDRPAQDHLRDPLP